MHTGGWADKLGNRYEGLWTVKQLLLLLHGRVQSFQLENAGPEDGGWDLVVTGLDGAQDAQQCKKNDSQNSWTILALARKGVISALRAHLSRDCNKRFSFISNREATDLKRLALLAAECRGEGQRFLAYVAARQSDCTHWKQSCKELGLASDAATGFEMHLRTNVLVWDDGPNGRGDVETLAELLLDGDRRDAVLRLADFAVEHRRLLWVSREFKVDCRPLSQVIFDMCDRLTDPANAPQEDVGHAWGFESEELSILLLRLYGQVEPPHNDPVLRKECLDHLDELLRNGNGSLLSVVSLLEL